MNIISPKALFRRGRFEEAVASIKRTIVRGGSDFGGFASDDDNFVDALGLKVEEHEVHRRIDNQKIIQKECRVVLPSQWLRPGSILFHLAVGHLRQEADLVVKTHLQGSDRLVYIHSFLERLLQKLMLLTLSPHIESRLLPTSHAYRPRRGRFTALLDARHQVRQGFPWLLRTDIHNFFASISVEMACKFLWSLVPEISDDLVDLVKRMLNPRLVLHRSHSKARPGPLGRPAGTPSHLLEGSVIAPLLSNVVGHFIVDVPLREALPGSVVAIRYSDDILIAGKTESACSEGLEILRKKISGWEWKLSEKKTTPPVNVLRSETEFLGKLLKGKKIKTPAAKIDEYVKRLTSMNPQNIEFQHYSHQVISELCLDPKRQFDDIRRRLSRASQAHSKAFGRMVAARKTRSRIKLEAWDSRIQSQSQGRQI